MKLTALQGRGRAAIKKLLIFIIFYSLLRPDGSANLQEDPTELNPFPIR